MELTKFTDEDAADLGWALIKAIGAHAYPGWHPAECPSEIVGDLRNECDELRRDAERYRKLRDEDAWGEDTSESGGSRWGELGEMHGAAFDAVVDALPSNWNVTATTDVIRQLKLVRPDLKIVLGGPEVSHEWADQEIVRLADYLITGWGDVSFPKAM